VQEEMLEASIPLIHTGKNPIGWIDSATWQGMQDILLEQKILTNTLPDEDLFTTQFLKSIYGTTEDQS